MCFLNTIFYQDGLVDGEKKDSRKKSAESASNVNVANISTNSGNQCELIELISTPHSRSENNNQTKAHVSFFYFCTVVMMTIINLLHHLKIINCVILRRDLKIMFIIN